MRRKIICLYILFLMAALPAFGYDAEKNHPGLTNAILETYTRLSNSRVLPNGTSLDDKLAGEVVTTDGTRHVLTLTVWDWIIIGSVEEDWGGIRAGAHYYDSTKSNPGSSDYSSGVTAWLSDSSSQSANYVASDTQNYKSGNYTYQQYRDWYVNNPKDYRAYKALGHMLHLIEDMGSPPHVRGLSKADLYAYESCLRQYGSDIFAELLSNSSSSYSGYITENETSLGFTYLSRSDIPSYSLIKDYYVNLAKYTRENCYTATTLYSSDYSSPGPLSIPPNATFASKEYTLSDGTIARGYTKGGVFVITRSLMKDKSGNWTGVAHISPENNLEYYKALIPVIVKYGVGFVFSAVKLNSKPTLTISSITSRHGGNIPIGYMLYDNESDRCAITVKYSLDGGTTYVNATAGPGGDGIAGISSSPTGISHLYYWNTEADITDNQLDVRVMIIPSDAEIGPEQVTNSFEVFNNYQPPSASYIGADTDRTYITISYTITDIDYSVASVSMYYSIDGGVTYSPATQGPTGDGVNNLATTPSPTTYTFNWDTLSDIGNEDVASVLFKIVPSDAVSGNGAAEISSAFPVYNKAPVVSVTQPTGFLHNDTIITYKLIDGASALHDISVEFSINGGATYNPCTEGAGSEGTVGLSSAPHVDGATHLFVWDTLADLGIGTTSAIIKITIVGGVGDGTLGQTTAFSIKNVPWIEFSAPVENSSNSGDITCSYKLFGPTTINNVDMTVEYSIDGGSTYGVASSFGHVTTGLTATVAGNSYSFLWASESDVIGENVLSDVMIRLTESVGNTKYASNVFKLENTGLADTPWPKRHGPDIRNFGRSPYRGPLTSTLKWSADIWMIYGTPVIGKDGTIYVGGRQYNSPNYYGLFAVNPWDGSVKWFLNCNQNSYPSTACAISKNGRIYYPMYGTYGGNTWYHLYCIEDVGGSYSVKWTFNLQNIESPTHGPTIDTDGTIYVVGRNATNSIECVIAINDDNTSSSRKWDGYDTNNSTGWSPRCTPAISTVNNAIYVTRANWTYTYGINRSNGANKWYTGTNYAYSGSAVVSDDENYVYSIDGGYMRQFNAATGAAWSSPPYNYSSGYSDTPAIGYNGTIYFPGDSGLLGYNSSKTQVFSFGTANVLRDDLLIDKDGYIFVIAWQYAQCVRDNGNGTGTSMWSYSSLQATGWRGSALGSDGCWIVPGGYDNASYKLRCFGGVTPQVYTITPASMATADATIIKIHGGGFKAQSGVNATAVQIKSAGATINITSFTVKNYTTIYATIPAGTPADIYDVLVTTADGANATSVGKLTITP